MSKGLRKAGLWGIIIWAVCIEGSASGASFTYEPITDPIESASFSVDFAAFTAHRTMADYELNYIKLVDLTGDLGILDLSDDFFGTSAWPDEPKINMGELETGIVSAEIDASFFPALAGGYIGLNFLFTDTGDSMFAMDFISLTLETAVETVTSYYGWPVGNENNGFGIGLADGADLPAPLSESIPVGATGTGFDETISSDTKIPEPTTLILLGLGGVYLLRKRNVKRDCLLIAVVSSVAISQTAYGITITDVNIYQMDFYGIAAPRIYDTNWGDFQFRVTPDADMNNYYLSLWIRRDSSSPAIWVIDNMVIPASSRLDGPFDGARFFSLADVVESGTTLDSIEYQMQLSTTLMGDTPPGGPWTSVSVTDGLYDVGDGLGVNPAPGTPAVPGLPPRPSPIPLPDPNLMKILQRFRFCRDIEEEPNHCTPASIARSLLWLHDTNAINLGTRADPNTLIADFNKAAQWFGRPNTIRSPSDPNEDPNLPQWWVRLLQGKLKMTKDVNMVNKFAFHWLPGDVCTPDGNAIKRGDWPTLEFIMNEFDANEDMEIMVDWLDVNNNIIGAHTMTIVDVNKHGIWVQDDEHQGQPDSENSRRYTRFVNGVPPDLNDLPKNRVTMVVSESPEPERENTHIYPPDGKYSPKVAVGAPASIKAAVQNNFVGVPGADVEFIKRAGSFTFTSGIILPDGSKTARATNEDGISEITIRGDEPGPALIEAAVTGVENSSAYLFFDVIPCPVSQNRDEDCDVDFIDYAIFADTWPGDWSELGLLCEQWLEGK